VVTLAAVKNDASPLQKAPHTPKRSRSRPSKHKLEAGAAGSSSSSSARTTKKSGRKHSSSKKHSSSSSSSSSRKSGRSSSKAVKAEQMDVSADVSPADDAAPVAESSSSVILSVSAVLAGDEVSPVVKKGTRAKARPRKSASKQGNSASAAGKKKVSSKRKRSKATSRASDTGHAVEEAPAVELYCVCRQPWDENALCAMIGCDGCEGWFHPQCIGKSLDILSDLTLQAKKFFCPDCEQKASLPPKLRAKMAMAAGASGSRTTSSTASRKRAPAHSKKAATEKRAKTTGAAEATGKTTRKRPRREAKKSRGERTGIYCICRRPYDSALPMLQCDSCSEWYHVRCVGLSVQQANQAATYSCPLCVRIEEELADMPVVAKKQRGRKKKVCVCVYE
jgi:PHD-finger